MTHDDARLRAMLAESGIAEEGSEQLLASLSTLERYAEDPPPAPSPELAAMLGGLRGDQRVVPLRRRPGRLLVATAVALGTVAAGGIAAAANELPPGAQDLVADFGKRYLNVELPRSEDRTDSAPRTPAPDRVAERAPTSAGIPAQVPTFEGGEVSVVVDPEAWANLGRLAAKPQPPAPSAPPPPTAPTPSLTPTQPAATPGAPTSSTKPSAPSSATPPPGPTGGTGGESVETGPKTPESTTPGGGATTAPEKPKASEPATTEAPSQPTASPSPTDSPSGSGTVARKDGSGTAESSGQQPSEPSTEAGTSSSGSTS